MPLLSGGQGWGACGHCVGTMAGPMIALPAIHQPVLPRNSLFSPPSGDSQHGVLSATPAGKVKGGSLAVKGQNVPAVVGCCRAALAAVLSTHPPCWNVVRSGTGTDV